MLVLRLSPFQVIPIEDISAMIEKLYIYTLTYWQLSFQGDTIVIYMLL